MIKRILHRLGICFPSVLISGDAIYVTCELCETTDVIRGSEWTT